MENDELLDGIDQAFKTKACRFCPALIAVDGPPLCERCMIRQRLGD